MSASSESLAAYQAALTAVESGKVAVNSTFKKVGDASPTLCDVNQKVSQVQNMTVVRNKGGEVIGYDYKYTTPQLPDTSMMEVNSNTDTGMYATGGGGQGSGTGVGRYNGSKYAGSVVTDPQSTDKLGGSGLVSSLISSAWAGVSALAKLGKDVSSTTGEALATLAEGFGNAFGDFCVDIGDATANAVRALFGVDSQGNTTMYLDEDVIGALAITAKEANFFSQGQAYIDIPTGYNLNFSWYPELRLYNGVFIRTQLRGSATWKWEHSFDTSHKVYIVFPCNNEQTLQTIMYAICDTSFNLIRKFYVDNVLQAESTYSSTYYSNYNLYVLNLVSEYGINGTDPATDTENRYVITENDLTYTNANYSLTSLIGDDLCTIIKYGTYHEGASIPGVSTQSGATVPVDAITGADPHVVAQNLVSEYPQIMGSPVQIVTMDDSCNVVTKNYYSVPISYSPTNLNISAPITGGLQISPSFNPDVTLDLPDINLDNYINQVIKIISGSGAGRDVTTEPTPDTDPDIQPDTPSIDIPESGTAVIVPDTGSGTTPATVPPTVDVSSMWHIYSPLPAALSALGSWLWSSTIIDQIVRLFTNPMEAIMGVHAIYCSPDISSQEPIVVGNLTSTASAPVVTSQYKSLNCGSVWLTEYFGNVFDYEPYTSVSLYLPFIGIVPLSVADVMRAKISVSYVIDFYTGACVAKVSVERDGAGGTIYEFPGDCSTKYPVSGASYTGLVQSVVASAMSALRVGMATQGAPGTAALGAAAAGAAFVGSGQKISISHSGSFSGNHGAMGSKIPYLIISRPITEMATNFELFDGLPANKQIRLSECSGYTKCKEVHFSAIGAYKSEQDEIENLLRSGVIL